MRRTLDCAPLEIESVMSKERYDAICRRIHRGGELLSRAQDGARGRVTYSNITLTALVDDVEEWARTLPTNPPTRHFRSRSPQQGALIERLVSFLDDQLAALDVARHNETRQP
jgi:hypothetical protein